MISPVSNDRPWSIFGGAARAEKDCKLTHVSLFSGCGGFDLGFRQAGFKTVFANDIDADACESYRSNLGVIVEGDIREVGLPKLRRRPDVLTAGFPCQPFSNAGSRLGTKDERGTLHSDDKVWFRSQLFALGYNVAFRLIDASHHHVAQMGV